MAMEDPHTMNTTWLIYLCCEGCGLTSFGSPIGKSQAKCLCIKQSAECDLTPDIMGDGGLCLGNGKFCCIQQAFQFIPKKIFIEFCGMRIVGGPKPGGGGFGNSTVPVSVGDDHELESLNQELSEAIKAEDFMKAQELKVKRDEFSARCRKNTEAIPDNLAM